MLRFLISSAFLNALAIGLIENQQPIDRRSVISTISSCTIGFAGLSQTATAATTPTFSAYNILPDSANLSPKLDAVDPMSFVQSIARNKNGGSVWLGEHHNSQRDHQFQAEMMQQIFEERSKQKIKEPMAIGLEQVQRQFQPLLDAYTANKISLEEMKQGVEWEKRWMWNFDYYKPIFETAKELNIKLLALNVDSEDLSEIEKAGYPGLPLNRLRKYINDPIGFGEFAKTRQFSTYVNYVISPSFEIHQKLGLLQYTTTGEKLPEAMNFGRFLSGRILWDEGMASAASAWCSANPGGLMLGMVGADHVKFRNGIPARFARMASPNAACTTVIINPTLIDSRPSGSVAGIPGADAVSPNSITLQLRYLKDAVDPNSEEQKLPESTGGVLTFSDYIVVTS